MQRINVGPVNDGLRDDRLAFNIDNDSFPTLFNAYQWRGRVKRKRGTSLLGRLRKFFNSTSTVYSSTATITLNGSGEGNLITGFSLDATGSIIPGTVVITDTITLVVYTDPAMDGTLSPSGTINYATGDIVILAAANNPVSAQFVYFPSLPVMGLETLELLPLRFPGNLGFDTRYSYNITPNHPYPIYNVTYYKNPAVSALLPGYIPKTTPTPFHWNGQDYQQFWSLNYENAFWVTNGVTEPFSIANIGMQYAPSGDITYVSNTATTLVVTIVGSPLVVGDFVFVNEWTGANADSLNFLSGYVTSIVGPNITITFPTANIGAGPYTPGIIQYLTNVSDASKDCIKFYDGDPTNGSATNPVFVQGHGWVNFCPPLSIQDFSIRDLPPDQYYLVGAVMIIEFKDRILFLGPVVQTSAADSQIYLQDTIIYSQNGTPYYTASFSNGPLLPQNLTYILLPDNQTSVPATFFEDVTGFGGFVTAGVQESINTCDFNEDALILGFDTFQTRVIYSGNDILPFNFFITNSELGSSSTFSVINTNSGVLTRGDRGYIITSQTEAKRFDLKIPDQVFQINLLNNGTERITAARDYINEWIYFSYPVNQQDESIGYKFNNQTLQFNYRDNSWAIFNECYTTYGTIQRINGLIWSTVGSVFPTWAEWNEPWNSGTTTSRNPEVMAGNQQGFVLIRDEGTAEAESLYIKSFAAGSQVVSPDHTLNQGDYIIIRNCIGTISYEVNNRVFSVGDIVDKDTFKLNPVIGTGTYSGGGVIERLYVPFIQTKQFPLGWSVGRKTRLGPQKYLLSTTDSGQMQLLIFLSQNSSSSYNNSPILPNTSSINDALIYSTILYTCPESTNLGLTPANININTPTAQQQSQIWHRMNTSLLGDTVQIGFTLSDEQMRLLTDVSNPVTITNATQADPCVLTCDNTFSAGQLVRIEDVEGMVELNDNIYLIIDSTATDITIGVDSSGFTAYTSGGIATVVQPVNNSKEIEIHAFSLDCYPSQLLV